jgi:hypothetical protein
VARDLAPLGYESWSSTATEGRRRHDPQQIPRFRLPEA